MTHELPPSLVQFGAELERAARREFSPRAPRKTRGTRRVFSAVAASTVGVAAATVAITGLFGATAGTSPAYALTSNSDGTITISLENLTTGISQLNQRFAQMGIDETVIPVEAGCTTPGLVADPGGTMNDSLTFKPTDAGANPDVDYFVAAEQLPDGSVGLSIGATAPPLPTCFSPTVLTVQNAG